MTERAGLADDLASIRSAEEIAEEIGAEPASEADKGHRRAHNGGGERCHNRHDNAARRAGTKARRAEQAGLIDLFDA